MPYRTLISYECQYTEAAYRFNSNYGFLVGL